MKVVGKEGGFSDGSDFYHRLHGGVLGPQARASNHAIKARSGDATSSRKFPTLPPARVCRTPAREITIARDPMLRAASVLPPRSFPETAIADRVVLDYDDRHRRRMVMEGVDGLSFLLDLPEAVPLTSDCGLSLEDGRVVLVVAAAEPLVEIKAKDQTHLVRVAWHLGNRHLPTQIVGQKLRIRRDHVIEEMVKGLGARVMPIEAPFDPEGGAYGHPTVTAHDHGHGHGHHEHGHHEHGHHGHDHHGHDHHGHDHGHGHSCDHDHGHDHNHDHAHGHAHDQGHKHR